MRGADVDRIAPAQQTTLFDRVFMKILSRIIGTVLALCGLGFVLLAFYGFWTEGWSWVLPFLVALGLGVALALAGRHYLRFDPDSVTEDRGVGRSSSFVITYRRQLNVLAWTAAAFSLLQLGAAWKMKAQLYRPTLWLLMLGASVFVLLCKKAAN